MAVSRSVKVNVQLTTGDAKAEARQLASEIEGGFKKVGKSASDSAKIARESVSTVSSELIESLGVDGDIANVFGENIAKMRASTLVLGGVVAGVVAGAGALVALTLKLGSAGRELQLSSEALGLSVEKLQLYARASESAGASTDTLTGVFTKFRQETGGNEQAFDSFLKSLEAVQNPIERLSVAQGKLGELSDDARRSILALTEQNGELRKSLEASGLILSSVEARELAKIDRRFEQVSIKAEGFAKRALLATIDGLAEFGVALGEGSDGLQRLNAEQAQAEKAANQAANALATETEALAKLSAQARIGRINKEVSDTLANIALNAKSAKEAVGQYQNLLKTSSVFAGNAADKKRIEENQKALDDLLNPKTKSGGRGGAANELAQLNKELAVFANTSSQAFKQRVAIDDLRSLKSQIEEIIRLRRELGQDQAAGFATQFIKGKELLDPAGIKGQLDFLKALKKEGEETGKTLEKLSTQLQKNNELRLVPGSAGAVKGEIEATAKLTDILRDAQIRANVETVEAKVVTSEYYQELLKTNAAEAESIRLKAQQTDAANAQAKQTELLKETTQALREQLEATGDQSTLLRTRRQLRRAGIDPDSADAAEATGLARQLDAQEEYRRAVEESRQANERFRQSVQSLFDALLDSPKRFFDQLKSLAKNFASSTLTNLFLGGNGGGGFSFGGGSGGSGGGGGLFGSLLNPANLLRTPGFNPGAAAGGVRGGGFLGQLGGGASNGLIGSLIGKGGGFLGKLFGLGGSSGATSVASGAVASAKAALGLGASGAGSAAGAAGAAGGGSTLASLGAFFTNPITAIVAGAAIGGFFLYRSLRNRDLKKLRELARGQYGVDVKDDGTLKAIREIGKSTFGKDYNSRLAETVALPTVKDLIAQYAENSGQAGNGTLVSRARLGDRYDAVNLVKREFGGPVLAGQAYIVGERRPELFIPNQSGRIAPSVNGGGSEMWAAVLGAIQANTMALQTLVTASPNDVLMKADPQAHAAVTRSAFAADYGLVNDLAYQVNR